VHAGPDGPLAGSLLGRRTRTAGEPGVEDDVAGPTAVQEALQERSLGHESGALRHPPGADVRGVDEQFDPVDADLVEGPVREDAERLSGEAAAAVAGGGPVTGLGDPVARGEEADAADQRAPSSGSTANRPPPSVQVCGAISATKPTACSTA
jgi:hypothetical protein